MPSAATHRSARGLFSIRSPFLDARETFRSLFSLSNAGQRSGPDLTGRTGTELLGNGQMNHLLCKLWRKNEGQDIAEYAAILAVILVLVVGTIRLVGSNANSVFSNAASSIQ